MTTRADIEAAIDALPPSENQRLLMYVAARLRAQGVALPDTRLLGRDPKVDWMAEDEAAMRRFNPNA